MTPGGISPLNLKQASLGRDSRVLAWEKAILEPNLLANENWARVLLAMGIGGIFLPILCPWLPLPLKTVLQPIGILSSFGTGLIAESRHQGSKLKEAIELAQKEQLKQQMAHQIAYHRTALDIQAQYNLLNHILTNTPQQHWTYWVTQYGLGGLIQQMYEQQTAIDVTAQPAPPEIDAAYGFATTEDLPRADIDTAWLTPHFARSSKMIAAERGAGKSFYLRWEVSTLMEHEEDPIVLFIDPHLRVSQMAAGHRAVWLATTPEEECSLIVHEPRKARQELEKVYSAVRKRIRGEEEVDRLIKVIVDEADADFWSEEGAGDSLKKLLKIVANEARKANVEITLVAHSLKKNTTGFDAAHLSQISWLMLGGILGSPDIQWPNDLDPKRWAEERELMQVSLDDRVGRACVLRERGEGRSSIRVVVMPPIAVKTGL